MIIELVRDACSSGVYLTILCMQPMTAECIVFCSALCGGRRGMLSVLLGTELFILVTVTLLRPVVRG